MTLKINHIHLVFTPCLRDHSNRQRLSQRLLSKNKLCCFFFFFSEALRATINIDDINVF